MIGVCLVLAFQDTEFLGHPRYCDLKAADERLIDVLKRLSDETKIPLNLESVPEGSRITLSVEGISPVAAIHLACMASGKARFLPEKLAFVAGSPSSTSRVTRELWGVYLTDAWLSSIDGSGDERNVCFDVAWMTRRPPWSVRVDLSEIIADADGSTILRGNNGLWYAPGDNGHVASVLVTYQPPKGRVASVTIRGKAELLYALEDGTVKIPTPAAQAESDHKTDLGPMHIKAVSEPGKDPELKLLLRTDADDLPVKAVRERGLAIRVVDEEGRAHAGKFVKGTATAEPGNVTWAYAYSFPLPAGKTIQRLEIDYPKRWTIIEVPFEFKSEPTR